MFGLALRLILLGGMALTAGTATAPAATADHRMLRRCKAQDYEWHWVAVTTAEDKGWYTQAGLAKSVDMEKGNFRAVLFAGDPKLHTYPTRDSDIAASDALYALKGTLKNGIMIVTITEPGKDGQATIRGRMIKDRPRDDPWGYDRIVFPSTDGVFYLAIQRVVQIGPISC